MSGERRCTFTETAYAAVVVAAPSWRRPFPRVVKSRVSRSSTKTVQFARLGLVSLGALEDVAQELTRRAERNLNRWVSRGEFRVKIRAVQRRGQLNY
jgi:hypothetical protein